jgi:hypothetical protein
MQMELITEKLRDIELLTHENERLKRAAGE